jgi:hypothetical protein
MSKIFLIFLLSVNATAAHAVAYPVNKELPPRQSFERCVVSDGNNVWYVRVCTQKDKINKIL